MDLIKPHARSAFRRIFSLYHSLSRMAVSISKVKESEFSKENDVLRTIQAIVIEQIATADDALEDWRDIIPEDVKEVEKRMSEKRGKETDNK
jgi:hypothetical protein